MTLPRNMLQSAVIWGIGDLIAQSLSVDKNQPKGAIVEPAASASTKEPLFGRFRFDFNRTAIAASYGGLVFTPLASRWYQHIQRLFPQSTLSSISRRVACDQLVWSPVALTIYFATMSAVHGGMQLDTIHDIRYKITGVLPTALITNWVFWVPLQFVNFFFVPPQRWLLTVNLAAIPWTAYLSWSEAQ